MSHFMLLLHDDPTGWQALSPEEMQQAVERYIAWSKHAFVREAHRLAEDPGRVIRSNGQGKPRAGDGPYSESKEVLGGYFTIEAADYDEAVRLAMDHPHLEHGTIEVRQLFGS